MIVHKLCVIVILFFVTVSMAFPAMRLPRGADDGARGNVPTTPASSPTTMSLHEEVFEIDEDQRFQVQEYLEKNGYLPLHFGLFPGYRVSEDNIRSALRVFQRFVHRPETGVLDEEIFNLMDANRCGVPDVFGGLPEGTYTTWARWQKLDLTYRIVSHPDTIDEGALHGLVRSAMEIWMEVTPLSLCEELDPNVDVDINIRHERGEHGDGLAFDGHGGILGHAFLPVVGEIHLDLDEDWTTGREAEDESNGTDYMGVVAHEIGHALGLLHSGVEGSIMFPFYMRKQNTTLSNRDIASIQSLYGNAESSEEVQHRCRDRTTTTPLPSTSTPNILIKTTTTTMRRTSSSSPSTLQPTSPTSPRYDPY